MPLLSLYSDAEELDIVRLCSEFKIEIKILGQIEYMTLNIRVNISELDEIKAALFLFLYLK